MKPNGAQGFFVGLVLWALLVFVVVFGLWWVLGVWPETPRAWLFILILSPILWVLIEMVSNLFIDIVDFMLPKVRYVNRAITERLAEARQESGIQAAGAMQFILYAARAGIIVLVIYFLWLWADQQFYLPDRGDAIQAARGWWYNNFK